MAQAAARVSPIDVPTPRPAWYIDFPKRLFRTKPLGFAGAVVIVLFILMAVAAPIVATHDPNDLDSTNILAKPSSDHLLGTDNLGRDLWSRLVYGARISLYTGFGAIALATLIAVTIGVSSAYFSGWYDLLCQRVIDVMMAFPWLILLLTIITILGPGFWQVVLALGILMSFGMSRVIRSAVLGIRGRDFITAAQLVGCSRPRIMWRHILVNIVAPVMVIATTGLGGAILAEASLSFLGLGVPPPTPSWGQMLSGTIYFWREQPFLPLAPGLAITVVVFAFNVFGDAVRDLTDPRLRSG